MTRWTIRTAAAVLAAATAFSSEKAHAQTLYTETFEGVGMLNNAFTATIIGSGLEMTQGYSLVVANDPTPGRGNYLMLPTGFYQCFCADPSATARSIGTYDLFAGNMYTFNFDWSRNPVGGGNGPFNVSLTASVGSHSVTFNDVAGFYYPYNWAPASLSWTQGVTELGARIGLYATGELYSGMIVDNLTLVSVPSVGPSPTSTVPEPSTWLLMTSGLIGVAAIARRRRA